MRTRACLYKTKSTRYLSKAIELQYFFKDSNSSEMSELWNKEAVSQLCKENCVSIRLEAGTQICDQFKAICKQQYAFKNV